MFMVQVTFTADNPVTLVGTDDEILTVLKVLLRSKILITGAVEVSNYDPLGEQISTVGGGA